MMRVWTHLKAIKRLLTAVVIGFCVMFSQMAHAVVPDVPSASLHLVEHVSAPINGKLEHADSKLQVSSVDHEHDGASKGEKCAMHCPSTFVPFNSSDVKAQFSLSNQYGLLASSLVGSVVPLAERPPRA